MALAYLSSLMVGRKQPGTWNYTSSSLVVPDQALCSRYPGHFAYTFLFACHEHPSFSSWQIPIFP